MAGPKDQQLMALVIPPGEAQKIYSPAMLAFEVRNFETTPEGTLKSVLGPTLYEPPRDDPVSLNNPHGIFHAGLVGGLVDTLLVRGGAKLYRHAGWGRRWDVLETGLDNDERPRYPDQFVVLGDKIIWTNGVDQARVITHDGMITPLGFDSVPGAPVAEGPEQPSGDETTTNLPNSLGYSWPGRLGTVGDVLDGQTGSVLDGSWYYYVQWEDVHGNRSALSIPSNAIRIRTMQAQIGFGSLTAELSDLLKHGLIRITGDAPDHAVAFVLHRTADVTKAGPAPRLLTRFAGKTMAPFPDGLGDADLGPETTSTVATPVFRVMCTHQGCLVIGNLIDDPAIVRRSEPGFPGTWPSTQWVYPDSGGAEVTALTSHGGLLLAFTETSVYSLQNFGVPVPLAQGIGCVAPRSIQSLPDGTLIWLSRDGFYGMRGGQIQYLSAEIHRTVRNQINRSRLRSAVSTYNPHSKEYMCALAPAGERGNKLILTYDGSAWKRQTLGISIADMCVTDDWRQYVLAVADATDGVKVELADGSTTKLPAANSSVYLLGHETRNVTPPDRDIIYRSGWIQADDVGMMPVHVRTMYIGLLDSWNGDFTVSFYRNNSWKEVISMTDVKAVGPDDGSGVVDDIAGSAVLGTAKTHDPRLFWRQVPVGLENAYSWAYQIKSKHPARLHIAAFAFDISVATLGQVRGRIPQRSDT